MESSNSISTESNSFFAVDDGNYDLVAESLSNKSEEYKLKNFNPIIFVILSDFIMPISLFLLSLSTTSVFGIIFLILMILHVKISSHITISFFQISSLLYVELIFSFVVFILTIVQADDTADEGGGLDVLGLTGRQSLSGNLTFPFSVSLITIFFLINIISIKSRIHPKLYAAKRLFVTTNIYFMLLIEIIHSFSISFLLSTNMNYYCYPLFLYFFLYSFNSFLKINVHRIMLFIVYVYVLVYALFDFFLLSYAGSSIRDVDAIAFNFIGNQGSWKCCFIFCSLLCYTTIVKLTSLNNSTRGVIYTIVKPVILKSSFVVLIHYGIFIYAMFFPNFLSILWIIIVFFSTFAKISKVRKYFFPFLSFTFIITFNLIAITLYDIIPHPNDNGTEKFYSFIKLFGFFKYENDIGFAFCCAGFTFISIIGLFSRFNEKLAQFSYKGVIYKEENQSNDIDFNDSKNEFNDSSIMLKEFSSDLDAIQDEKLEFNEKLDFYLLELKKTYALLLKIIVKAILFAGNFIYKMFIFFSLPALVIISIYPCFYEGNYVFRVLSFIVIAFVLLFQYFKYTFQVIKIISALIIIVCAFYSAFESYDCKGEKNCLFFGYFKYIEDSGLLTPPNISLHFHCWSVTCIFFLSVFLTFEPRAIKTYFPSYVIAVLYLLATVCNFVYVFLFDIQIFSIIYLITGLMILGFQCLHMNLMRTLSIMINLITLSIHLSIYNLTRYEYIRTFFVSHVPSSIINIDQTFTDDSEIIVLSIMLFLSSIVFRGAQSLENNKIITSILFEFQKVNQTFYFYISWIFIYFFSLANQYPTILKLLILVLYSIGPFSSKLFYKNKFLLVIFFSVLIIIQFLSHLFFSNFSDDTLKILHYLGVAFTEQKLTNGQKNSSLIWQLLNLIVIILSSPKVSKLKKRDRIVNKTLKSYVSGIWAIIHYFMPQLAQISFFVVTSFNGTILSLITYIFILIRMRFRIFFQKIFPLWLVIITICFLVQYLLYIPFPYEAFGVQHWSFFNYISPQNINVAKKWFEFLGLYSIKPSSLATNFTAMIVSTFYLQYYKKKKNDKKQYDKLPNFLRIMCDFFVSYIFEICYTFILVLAACSGKSDGLFFFITGFVFFFTALLFESNKKAALAFVRNYIHIITFLRTLSRLPVFVDNNATRFVIMLFDLPMSGYSQSVNYWILMFTLYQICVHVMQSDIYLYIEERNMKRLAYRFIRDRQLKIIEKLDQEIIVKMRAQEIKAFSIHNTNSNSETTYMNFLSDSRSDLFRVESQSTLLSHENPIESSKIKWYTKFYNSFILPQIFRFCRILMMTLPINQEAGINVLTLESLTLLLKRCLSYYENDQEFYLEERERQFLLSLPPSFSYQFSSLYFIIEKQSFSAQMPKHTIGRYFSFLLRKLSLPILIFFSFLFLMLRPYIFGILIFGYVCCIISVCNFYGFPNIYRFYLILIFVMMTLKSAAATDLIAKQLNYNESFLSIQNSIQTLHLIGLDPSSSIVPEVLLFIASILYIVDKLKTLRVFSTNYYYEKFSSILPGFPVEYCYGIMDDPVNNLGMNLPQNRTFFNYAKNMMNRIWVRTTYHHNFILFLNFISILLILICWPDWVNNDQISSLRNQFYEFSVDILFVFIFLFEIIFTLVVYFCCLNELFFILSIVEIIWFVYSHSVIFFYIRSLNSVFLGSAKLYIIVRIIQHLLASHFCYIGKASVSYRYPNFSDNWRGIRFFDKILRYCPFALEIRIILLWLGRETNILFNEYAVIKTMELQLEIQMCNQMEPIKKVSQRKNVFKGVCLIFLFMLIIFIPLIVILGSFSEIVTNKILMVEITAGIENLPPFYKAKEVPRSINKEEYDMILNSNHNEIPGSELWIRDSLFVADFPLDSRSPFDINQEVLNDFRNNYNDGFKPSYYLKYNMFFERPTTSRITLNPTYLLTGREVNETEVNTISSISILNSSHFNNYPDEFNQIDSFVSTYFQSIDINSMLPAPRVINTAFNIDVSSMIPYNSNINFSFNFDSWKIEVSSFNTTFFNNTQNSYKLLIFSSGVLRDSTISDLYNYGDRGFLGIYILIIILIGIALRKSIIQKADTLWRDNIKRPVKLFRMIIAINMFRNSHNIQAEKEMADMFLDTLKSHRKTIAVTSNE